MQQLSRARPAARKGWPNVFRATMLGTVVALLCVRPSPASAQQFTVDDSPIVERGACHVEFWHGRLAGWLLPACQPIRNLELTAGIGWIRDVDDGWSADHVVQAKYVVRDLQAGGVGISVAAGAGFSPAGQTAGQLVHELYGYVPVTVASRDERFMLHVNVGWAMERDGDAAHRHTHHHFTWGGSADAALVDRIIVMGEIFGTDRDAPAFQFGFSSALLPERLYLDVTYGDRLRDRSPAERIGLVVGMAWTPAPFF